MQRPTPPLLPPIATAPWKSPTSPPPTASSTQSNRAQTISLLLQHKVFDFFAYVREHLLFAVKQKKKKDIYLLKFQCPCDAELSNVRQKDLSITL